MTKKSYKKKVFGLLGVVRKINRVLEEELIMLSLNEKTRVYSYNIFRHFLLGSVVTTFTVVKSVSVTVGAFLPVSSIILGGILAKIGYGWATSPTGLVSLGFTGGLSILAISSQIGTVALGISSVIWGLTRLIKLGRDKKKSIEGALAEELRLFDVRMAHCTTRRISLIKEAEYNALLGYRQKSVTERIRYFSEEVAVLIVTEEFLLGVESKLREHRIKIDLIANNKDYLEYTVNDSVALEEDTLYHKSEIDRYNGLKENISDNEILYLSDEIGHLNKYIYGLSQKDGVDRLIVAKLKNRAIDIEEKLKIVKEVYGRIMKLASEIHEKYSN